VLRNLPGVQPTIVLAVAIILANNLATLWAGGDPARAHTLDLAKVGLWAAVVAWSLGAARLSLEDLGFRRGRVLSSVGWGLGAGVGLAIPALVFFTFPLVLPGPVQYAGYRDIDLGGLAALLVPRFLLSTALLEETLFRGLLQFQAVRALGAVRGIALSCAFFIVWHVAADYQALDNTDLTGSALPFIALYVATAVPVGGAGLVFSLIRHATGNLAGSIVAHMLVNSIILFFFAFGAIRG